MFCAKSFAPFLVLPVKVVLLVAALYAQYARGKVTRP